MNEIHKARLLGSELSLEHACFCAPHFSSGIFSHVVCVIKNFHSIVGFDIEARQVFDHPWKKREDDGSAQLDFENKE